MGWSWVGIVLLGGMWVGWLVWRLRVAQSQPPPPAVSLIAPPPIPGGDDPTLATVVLINNDVTPMDVVVAILETAFALPTPQAMRVMMHAHYDGEALVARLAPDVADESIAHAQQLAQAAGYSLQIHLRMP